MTSTRLPEIASAPPPEFDGPGDVWSPETLLRASPADCFVLSFRSIARASKLEWSELACRVEGVLERVDGITQFTRYTTFASSQGIIGVRRCQGAQAAREGRALVPDLQLIARTASSGYEIVNTG